MNNLLDCEHCEEGKFIQTTKQIDKIVDDSGIKVKNQTYKQCDNCETVMADHEDLEFNSKQKHYYVVKWKDV